MEAGDLHVVFGAGQVGSHLVATLARGGCRVRVVRRSDAPAKEGAEVVRGDAADRAFCVSAARGARVVYHCMNPPYSTSEWQRLLPVYMDNLIEAAASAGARLVVLDNLYMLGRPAGRTLSEETPSNPCSRKGEIRARAAEALFDAHRRGTVRATCGRASDFYGPAGELTNFGGTFWKPVLRGRAGRMIVPLDARHTYHYIPDVADGLARLGLAEDDAEGRWWMLPCAPAGSARDLIESFARALGRAIRATEIPPWLVRAFGVFVPLLREVPEMRYQWDEPFVCDDGRFRARFAASPAPVEEAARATVAWAQATYGAR